MSNGAERSCWARCIKTGYKSRGACCPVKKKKKRERREVDWNRSHLVRRLLAAARYRSLARSSGRCSGSYYGIITPFPRVAGNNWRVTGRRRGQARARVKRTRRWKSIRAASSNDSRLFYPLDALHAHRFARIRFPGRAEWHGGRLGRRTVIIRARFPRIDISGKIRFHRRWWLAAGDHRRWYVFTACAAVAPRASCIRLQSGRT